jgi:hypothetical protein
MLGEKPGRVPVRVLAWGVTEADIDSALARAGQGWARNTWQFAQVERLTGTPCPIDVKDPKSIAADAGFDWAYAVYSAAPARASR